MKLIFRLVTGLLILVIVALIGVIGWFTYGATQTMGKAEQAAWFTPKPDGDTPLNLFEMTASKATFGAGWNSTGFPCRSVARLWAHRKETLEVPVSQIVARDMRYHLEGSGSLVDTAGQIALACTLEQRYSDTQLLRVWTKRFSFASNVVGVDAGAQAMFKKHVAMLSPKEAATLAAVLQNPVLFRSRDKWNAEATRVLTLVGGTP